MKTKILCQELLKTRNALVKKYLKTQEISIYSLHSCEAIEKRLDDLMDIQEAIKQYDILIGYAKKCSYSWDCISLITDHENVDTWKPKTAKLSDWKDFLHDSI